MEEISAERRLQDTWYLQEAIQRGHLIYNVKLKRVVIIYCGNMLLKYLLHNLALFCLCNLLHREKICDTYSNCHKISIKAIVINKRRFICLKIKMKMSNCLYVWLLQDEKCRHVPFKYFLINKLLKRYYFFILPESYYSAIVSQLKMPNVRREEPFCYITSPFTGLRILKRRMIKTGPSQGNVSYSPTLVSLPDRKSISINLRITSYPDTCTNS